MRRRYVILNILIIHNLIMKVPIILILFFAAAVQANPALDDLVSRLQNKYDSLEALKASFTQSYQSKRFSDRIIEKGIVYFQKGGLMRWEYQQPEKKIFVCDGNHYFFYVVEDRQVIKADASGEDQRSPALFLAGRGNFVKDFRAEWADQRQGSHLIKLIPVQPQPDFMYLIVDVDPVGGLILRLLVVDVYENRTEYTFQQIQENPRLPSGFFAFEPPKGTEVLYQRGEAE